MRGGFPTRLAEAVSLSTVAKYLCSSPPALTSDKARVSEEPAKPCPPSAAEAALCRIGELAERAGVSRQVVGLYCMYGLLAETARTPGGQRLFDEAAVRRIRLIQDLKRHYTLREIREIFIRDRL